jgi:hypothetical protein
MDHGLDAVAVGDLVAKVRNRPADSQVAIDETPVRVHMPALIVLQSLRIAQALQRQLSNATTRLGLHVSPTREHVRMLRACTTMEIIHLFFPTGGARIDCLTENLVAS